MAFTPDGIAPPGIPLLGCSPPTTTMRYRTVFGGAERSLGSRTVFGVVSFCHVPPSIIYNCIQWHTKQKFCPGWWSEMTFFIKNISKTAKIYEDLSLAS